jgi:ferredoxin
VPKAPRKPPQKYEKNAPGQWFVTDQCFACLACVDILPTVFRLDYSNGGYAFVFRQPETAEEDADCRQAQKACEHHAIHFRKANLL